jgi:hypothetical protein
MAQQIVVSVFDVIGNMVCYCVDILHPPGEQWQGNIIRVGADIRDWLPPFRPIKILFVFPPCTHVAVSGARWFREKAWERSLIHWNCLTPQSGCRRSGREGLSLLGAIELFTYWFTIRDQ